MLHFSCALIAVRDMEISKQFYKELFDQQVTLDFGQNVVLSGGFALQESFGALAGIGEQAVRFGGRDMELYFETDDLEAFVKKAEAYSGLRWVHPVKQHAWAQRVVRLYDPDEHIVEVGESMDTVILRLLAQGNCPEETARISQYPLEYVQKLLQTPSGGF